MAIDSETKNEYNELIGGHKKQISEFDKELAALKKRAQKDKKLTPLFKVGIISVILKQAELRLKMNGLSEQIMNMKNNGFLDATKKDIHTIFTHVEAIVTLRVDESIDFNREMLNIIKPFNAKQRLNMCKHIKKAIENLIRGYGDSTKWKWSFPELWAKLAITSKNLFDFREFQASRDPRMEFYYDLQEFLPFMKDALFFAAGENANKFRLSTKAPNDMMFAVRLMEDLRRIASLTGDEELVKKSKSGIEAYKATLKTEEEKKKSKSS